MTSDLIRKIDSVLFGSVFTLRNANRVVQKKIDECDANQFEGDSRLEHDQKDLDEDLAMSVQRLERIENKAMGTLLGVAVAIAVFGATSRILGGDGVVADHAVISRYVVAAGLLLAMLYLFGSGLLALGAYKIGQVYRPTLSDRPPVADSNTEKRVTVSSIEQNQRAATLRSNKLAASFACLRNGLIVVLVLGIFVVGLSTSIDSQDECSTTVGRQVTKASGFG